MLAGALLVSHITTPFATWASLLLLLAIHISMNYLAVRAVSMRTLNRQRANIVFTNYYAMLNSKNAGFKVHPFLTPEEVSPFERIFEYDGVLRWHDNTIIGYCSLGIPFNAILDCIVPSRTSMRAYQLSSSTANSALEKLLSIFATELYILLYSRPRNRWIIVLKSKASTETHLKSWLHALLCAKRAKTQKTESGDINDMLNLLQETQSEVNEQWKGFKEMLEEAGWDLDHGCMETKSGTRMEVVKGT